MTTTYSRYNYLHNIRQKASTIPAWEYFAHPRSEKNGGR